MHLFQYYLFEFDRLFTKTVIKEAVLTKCIDFNYFIHEIIIFFSF